MSDVEPLKPLRTWSHLAGQRRRPSEYEIVSTNLAYNARNPESPFELGPQIPLSQWFIQYRHGSPLTGLQWEDFRDPDEVTYRSYNIMQDAQETYVDGLLDQYEERGYDANLTSAWLSVLARLYTPSRYVLHTLQMAAHYGVQIAPSSTLRNCWIYQAADELRALSHVAYRTAQLARAHPGFRFGDAERAAWETDPAWQGMRELMERVLIAYDWGENLVALNLVAKPAIDACLFKALAHAARAAGDDLLGLLADAVYRDALRSRHWTAAFVAFALTRAENKPVVEQWIVRWTPVAARAVATFCSALADGADLAAQVAEETRRYRAGLGLAA